MRNLLILGAGGHGRVVADAAGESKDWSDIAFLDDGYGHGEYSLPWSVIGKFADFSSVRKHYTDAVVAIGNNELRLSLIDNLMSDSRPYVVPTIVHPKATVSRFATLGEGTVVLAGSVINAGATVGRGCIVNTSSVVEHDCVLEDGVHVSPGACIAGQVHIGKGTWIGLGSRVRERLRIGSGVVIGAGSVVVEDVDDSITVVGIPARILGNQKG
jgi:sugar O-acyltransferase (sialic acid O-acetyltransferase NeuD family)